MLKLEQYERIRRLVLVEGVSQREAARRLGHSRRTVRKAVEHSSPPPYQLKNERPRRVLGSFESFPDSWLQEDEKRPRKQRQTAKRMYERLRDEHGFTGCYETVKKFVREARGRPKEVFMPLQYDPGEEAQVDWGQAVVIENGVQRRVHLFCTRLCHSSASFVRAYARETQEALLDGHVRAFEFFGGVPRRLAYDNLKTAVVTVGKGQDRRLTKGFLRLKSHFLFTTRFCNPARGNEKGHVENLVRYAQRNFLTPVPEVSSLKELNRSLLEGCEQALRRSGLREGKSFFESFSEEKEALLPLPETAFEACQESTTWADKQCLVRFGTNYYSVPMDYAHRHCLVRGYVDRVEILSEGQRVASHRRSYGASEWVLEPLHFVPLLERKPGCLDNARPFKKHFWGNGFAEMRKELEFRYGGEGTRKFIRILLLFREYPEGDVRSAVELCVQRCCWSEEAVKNVLGYEPTSHSPRLDLSDRPALLGYGDGIRPAKLYHQLLEEEVLS